MPHIKYIPCLFLKLNSKSLRIFSATVFLFTLSACTPHKQWIDEVLLHDGRVIEVQRDVAFTCCSDLKRQPDQYTLNTKNPDTGKVVFWSGERGFNPILLDFWNNTPYLVIIPNYATVDLKQYGCPEIPYIFFKQNDNGKWIQVTAGEFPKQLLRKNLSINYYDNARVDRRTKELIERANSGARHSYEPLIIPTDFSSWTSKYKNEYRVHHYHDGCQNTVPSNEDPSHPQSQSKLSQNGNIEILETKNYDPVWVMKIDDWSSLSFDKESYAKCQTLVKRVGDDSNTPELRGWLLFTNDPTGKNKAQDRGGILCNGDALWFPDYVAEPGRVVLTKFTISGDFLYRLSFEKLNESNQYQGGIMQSTFKSKDGYLYFEWWNTNQAGYNREIKKNMKVRIKEPN